MRFVIILYLMIILTFSLISTYTPFQAVTLHGQTQIESAQNETLSQAKGVASTTEKSRVLTAIPSITGNVISIMVKMTTFNFEIPGAPIEINYFLRGFFGILSVVFWISVIREVINLVKI